MIDKFNILSNISLSAANSFSMDKAEILSSGKRFPKQALVFTCLQYRSFENTVGKGEIARNEQFLLFPQCFLPIWTALCHFHQIQNCHLQTLSVWKCLKFVVRERVNKQSLVLFRAYSRMRQ